MNSNHKTSLSESLLDQRIAELKAQQNWASLEPEAFNSTPIFVDSERRNVDELETEENGYNAPHWLDNPNEPL